MEGLSLTGVREVELAKALEKTNIAYKRIKRVGMSPLLANIVYFVRFWFIAILASSLEAIYPAIYRTPVTESIMQYSINFFSKLIAFIVIGVVGYFVARVTSNNNIVSRKTKNLLDDYNEGLIIIHSCYNSIIRNGDSDVLDKFEEDIIYISNRSEEINTVLEKVCPEDDDYIVDISFNHSNYGSLITLKYYNN